MKRSTLVPLLIVLAGLAWSGAPAHATKPPEPPPGAAYLDGPDKMMVLKEDGPHRLANGPKNHARYVGEINRNAPLSKLSRAQGSSVTPIPLPPPRSGSAMKTPLRFAPRGMTLHPR
jgi:hypothetical protein